MQFISYWQECSQTKYSMSAQTEFGQKKQHSMFFCYLLSSYELWNYLFLAGSKHVAFKLQCFVLILHKLLYSLGKNILRTPCFILVLFHCVFCFFMSIRNEKKSLLQRIDAHDWTNLVILYARLFLPLSPDWKQLCECCVQTYWFQIHTYEHVII